MPGPEDIARETEGHLREAFADLAGVIARDPELFHKLLLRGIGEETEACVNTVQDAGDGNELAAVTARFAKVKSLVHQDPDGTPIGENLDTPHLKKWYPGLDNDGRTLREVLDTFPGDEQVDVPRIVQLLENPSSPVRLPGAVTLVQHDAIHVLLGRGVLDQDEAFVIGFTAGASPEITRDKEEAFRTAFLSYPEPWRIKEPALDAFSLGVEAARIIGASDLTFLDVPSMLDRSLGELRQELRIDADVLRMFYKLESEIIRDTPASNRLPKSR